MSTRGFLGIALAVLACSSARPARGADWVFSNIIPSWGQFDVTISEPLFSPVIVVSTTDSDEGVQTASVNNATALLGHSFFSIVTGDAGHPAFSLPPVARNPFFQTTPLVGDMIDAEPFELYDGNWALGIGLSDETGLKAFIQFRESGSTATVLDSSLATQAVAKGLWSSVTDYFEFQTSLHATINPLDPTPNGPNDYFGQALPEPEAAALLASIAPCALCLRRRFRGRAESR
jgi:hypothetical protein